jgi:CRISPR/Cas system-associated exonuclease Cas4 (RecB family)
MSQYYNPRRTRNLFDPGSEKPFKLSRAKLELYIECPYCFYLDRRLGVKRPPGFPFNLNNAVDTLLKKEFDLLRRKGEAHLLMEKYDIDAIPARHDKLNEWRYNFTGIRYLYEPTNFIVAGALDDLWQNSKGEYIVVDYKATSKDEEITELNKTWQDSYKRQLEVYQWLLRRNGYKVSDTGYFVYCNGKTDLDAFDGKLEFDITLIAHKGDDSWIENKIKEIHTCLMNDRPPPPGETCDFCRYQQAAKEVT